LRALRVGSPVSRGRRRTSRCRRQTHRVYNIAPLPSRAGRTGRGEQRPGAWLLQRAEGLLRRGEVRVDLDGALVGVARELRVAGLAAALVGLAEPVVRLGARGHRQEGAVLRAPDRLVDLAGLEVGAGEVGEQR